MPSGTDLTSSTPTINGADRRNSTDGNNASNGSSFTRTVSFNVISLNNIFKVMWFFAKSIVAGWLTQLAQIGFQGFFCAKADF